MLHKASQRQYLLVPMQPTPNGRLHVGHGAGTYLRADVLARALRVRGHVVHSITGSDGFENWVLAEAQRTGRSPEETCDHYHAGIQRDLTNLGAQPDVWIDPRSAEHYPGYRRLHEDVLALLRRSGGAAAEKERIPYSVDTGREVVGTWIAGGCPNCGKPCGGSSCTFCSEHFQPEEVIDARSRLDDSPLEWRTEESWFARPRATGSIVDHLTASGLRPSFVAPAARYLHNRGGRIRLTGRGSWGITGSTAAPGTVITNGYYLYSVYCGEVHQALTGAELNPFHPDSGVTVVGLFGSDNSTPGLVAPGVIAQGSEGTLKPFDHTVVNAMLQFEGQKCSTSKRHGIWLSELLENTDISGDELRLFLARAPLDEDVADITLAGLVDSLLDQRSWYAQKLAPALEKLRQSVGRDDALDRDPLRAAAEAQRPFLEPGSFDLPRAVEVLDEWMRSDLVHTPLTWMLGLAVLGEPVTPTLAGELWQALGYDGRPTLDTAMSVSPKPRGTARPTAGAWPLTVQSLLPFVHRSGEQA